MKVAPLIFLIHVFLCLSNSEGNSEVASIGRNGLYWDSFSHKTSPVAAKLCTVGTRQSPIDIPLSGNIKASYDPFVYINYEMVPTKYSLLNNGHTAKMSPTINPPSAPTVEGGGLGSAFQFAQLHFHWGDESQVGSEHLLGGKAYPLEMHLVHFNKKYGDDLAGALGRGRGAFDTLAVLGVLFQVSEEDNPDLNPIVKSLSSIKEPMSNTDIRGFPLFQLLPGRGQSFYRYMGSLTTPLCNQIVIWTVFKKPVPISERQLEQFRSLQFGKEPQALVNTFRNPQPINGRLIFDISSGSRTSIYLPTLLSTAILLKLLTP